MEDTWEAIFDVVINGRDVKGETYCEGGYRVSTTQKSDYEGYIGGDTGSTIIIPPSQAGTPIDIDAETLEELERTLVEDGEFSPDEAREIVDNFHE